MTGVGRCSVGVRFKKALNVALRTGGPEVDVGNDWGCYEGEVMARILRVRTSDGRIVAR